MLVSVIIPVYNSGKYLQKAIESILIQKIGEIEIVLINDGSTDDSAKICEKYHAQYSNIIYIETKNYGPSHARNVGLSNCSGQYVMFLDSDDSYLDGAFTNVELYINSNVDIIISNIMSNNEINEQNSMFNINGMVSKDSVLSKYIKYRVPPGPCRYTIKKELLTNNNIKFPENYKLAEDCLWLCNLFNLPATFAYNKEPFYLYQYNENSITNNIDMNKIKDLMDVSCELYSLLNDDKKYCKFIEMYIFMLLSNIWQSKEIDNDYIVNWLKSNKYLLNSAMNYTSISLFFSKIIGSYNTLVFVNILIKLRKGA